MEQTRILKSIYHRSIIEQMENNLNSQLNVKLFYNYPISLQLKLFTETFSSHSQMFMTKLSGKVDCRVILCSINLILQYIQNMHSKIEKSWEEVTVVSSN